jgi:hypothetical protein
MTKKRKRTSKAERVNRFWQRENERQWRAMWRAEGRSLADYKAGLGDQDSEVWKWRRAKGAEAIAEQEAAWLRDHPGNPLPEHRCSMTDEAYAEYVAWCGTRQEQPL